AMGRIISLKTPSQKNHLAGSITLQFSSMFMQKICLVSYSSAYIIYPGGFGTMDVLFEILTLIQTKKIARRPVVLVGKDYWKDLFDFIVETFVKEKVISPQDPFIVTIVDNDNEAIKAIGDFYTHMDNGVKGASPVSASMPRDKVARACEVCFLTNSSELARLSEGASSPVVDFGNSSLYPYSIFNEGPRGRGIFGLMKKRIVNEIRTRFIRGKTGYTIDILSFGAIRYLERPSLPEAHRIVISFLEDERLYPEKWSGMMLTPENFKVIVVDRGERTLKEAMQGIYGRRVFGDLKKFRLEESPNNAAKELMERYFDDLGDGNYRVKEIVRQFIEPRPATLIDFAPAANEKFDLILYNYIEHLIEIEQKRGAPIGTAEVANRMLHWFKEGGMLLTTASKWFNSLPGLTNVETGKAYFLARKIRQVPLYLWQYFSVAYTQEKFDEQFQQLMAGFRQRLKKMGCEVKLNERLINFAWQQAKEVHLPQQRERGWPFLVHPLGALNILLSNDAAVQYLITKTQVAMDVYIAAILLHDIIEDAPGDRERIRQKLYNGFVRRAGREKAEQLIGMLLMVTKDKGQDDEPYLKRIFESQGAIGLGAQIIKVPDRIDNFRNPPPGKTAKDQIQKVAMTTRFIEESQLPLVMKMLYLKLRDLTYVSEVEKLGLGGIGQPMFLDHIIPWFDFMRDEQGRFIGIRWTFKGSNNRKIAVDQESLEKSFHLIDMDYRNLWRGVKGAFVWEGRTAVRYMIDPEEIARLDKIGIYLWLKIGKGVSDKVDTVSFGEKTLIRSMAILKPNSYGRQIVGFSSD
ncbi:MAG TPA: LOG family protein, partial [Candidatus Omnitrophota bacterium]|nr:LOG family protein [Candidatus Omnitrophota bacterium]